MNSWFLVILIFGKTSFSITFDNKEDCNSYRSEHYEELKQQFSQSDIKCSEGIIRNEKLILFKNSDELI